MQRTSRLFTLIILLALAGLAPAARAEIIQIDHVSNSTWWSGQKMYAQFDYASLSLDSIAVSTVRVTESGHTLGRIGGLFGTFSSGGVPNGGNLEAMSWRVLVFETQSAWMSDPFFRSGETPGLNLFYPEPTNPNYLSSVGQSETNNLYYVEVDLSPLEYQLLPDQTYIVALLATGVQGVTGTAGMVFASGGSGVMGMPDPWYKSEVPPGFGPDTFVNLEFPERWGAYVVTTNVPSPSGMSIVALGLLFATRRRRT